jgi:hypothetical protein
MRPQSLLRLSHEFRRCSAHAEQSETFKGEGITSQEQEARCLSNDLGGLIAVVGLRGGSRVTDGLSARGLANIAVRDWSDDFTFIVGDHRY